MNLQTFFDQTDEHSVTNRDKLAQRQRIIRRVDTTAKDRSFEAAEGRHDGVVVVDGKLIGFGIHSLSDPTKEVKAHEKERYMRLCTEMGLTE